jgi:SOS-response transcriptional repressor LexA
MNSLQSQLLELADTQDLGAKTYYALAKELGVGHPYRVKFALDQLIRNGFLVRDKKTGSLTKVPGEPNKGRLLNIPILGQASCGVAVEYATEQLYGFLKVSPGAISIKNPKELFALKAVGDSMNKASISGKAIDSGDYVIIRSTQWQEIEDGDYIVSVMDGMANVKRLSVDRENHRLVLNSESAEDTPPIIIAPEDLSTYYLNGKVVEVIKAPKRGYN